MTCPAGHRLVAEDRAVAVASAGTRRRFVCSFGHDVWSPPPDATRGVTAFHQEAAPVGGPRVCVVCARAFTPKRRDTRCCSRRCGGRLAGVKKRMEGAA